MCCLHLLANHRLAWEFKRILLTEALVLCFRLGLSSTSGIGEHVEELYCVPVRYAVEFRAALFAVVFEPLGKNVVQKKTQIVLVDSGTALGDVSRAHVPRPSPAFPGWPLRRTCFCTRNQRQLECGCVPRTRGGGLGVTMTVEVTSCFEWRSTS